MRILWSETTYFNTKYAKAYTLPRWRLLCMKYDNGRQKNAMYRQFTLSFLHSLESLTHKLPTTITQELNLEYQTCSVSFTPRGQDDASFHNIKISNY